MRSPIRILQRAESSLESFPRGREPLLHCQFQSQIRFVPPRTLLAIQSSVKPIICWVNARKKVTGERTNISSPRSAGLPVQPFTRSQGVWSLRALLVREHGPIETLVLAEVPDPVPKPGQVLVDVRAASINFPDLLVIGGTYQKLPARPFSPGKDLAGIVAGVGEGVTTCKRGDRVCAQVEFGAYAEKCIVPQLNCHVMPPAM